MKLDNKRILITGGTSGIGLELVKRLAQHNEVIIISRSAPLPQDLANNTAVHLHHADLSRKSELEMVMDQIQRQYDSIDILINNAAVQFVDEFTSERFKYDGIQSEININFTAICHLTYLALPLLQHSRQGLIVNMNSGLAIAPKRSSAIYCATKAALDSLSLSLQYQLAETTVSVQQVFLPLVETAMTAGRGSGKLQADDVARRIVKGIERGEKVNDVGKVKLLRIINAFAPGLARAIMKNN